MIDGTRKEGVVLFCEICKKESLIPWNNVYVPGYFAGCYGEFNCPECNTKEAVYTEEPITKFSRVRNTPVNEGDFNNNQNGGINYGKQNC